ncbi:conserved hypothetical protein [Paecilomyces variotii No. 5]|uniref:Protein BIG1 n=1 Tax=Byssochlamys spectabilis (strain No. 5 / NBRC 109023) TaxID=1356009 RepID=V5HWA6_BYSSN|nr:conserved hypothetical protein [Paecilomyces variotii No. 5]
MHLRGIGLLTLGAAVVDAFVDTSPFILASTSDLANDELYSRLLGSSAQLKTASSLSAEIASALSTCPSDYYVIASQPGVHVSDFSKPKSAPRLYEKLSGKDSAIKSSFSVSEVSGELDAQYVQDLLEKKCGAQTTHVDASSEFSASDSDQQYMLIRRLAGSYPSTFEKGPRVISVDFPALPSAATDRAYQLQHNDGFLADIVDRISSKKYTIIYVTSPREVADGEQSESFMYHSDVDSQEPVHMDLKRDYASNAREGSSGQSVFEEYQFLTPGIFMGLIAGFAFLAILYVGFSALTSLQVPYAAFEKDTAPSSQKKQQ